jgi:hypothetical protein
MGKRSPSVKALLRIQLKDQEAKNKQVQRQTECDHWSFTRYSDNAKSDKYVAARTSTLRWSVGVSLY